MLGRVESRFILSVAIIVSLLPFDWVPGLDGLFLLLFSIEFVLRALLAVDPNHELVEPVTNWLVRNRRGSQWSSAPSSRPRPAGCACFGSRG